MFSARWVAIFAAGALAFSACAPTPRGQALSKDFVVLANGNGLVGVDFGLGRLAYQTPQAIASPDWTRLYVGGADQLSLLDGLTGSLQTALPIPQGLQPVAVS